MDRKDLQSLSRCRLLEAKALLGAGLPNGAYYLAGYSIECALKACIAKNTRRFEFPDKKRVDASYTHNLKELAKLATLEKNLTRLCREDKVFGAYWEVVSSWSEASRYELHTFDQAEKLLESIGNRSHGVMRWIKRSW